MKRVLRPWTELEIEKVVSMWTSNYPIEYICEQVRRCENKVKSKVIELKLPKRKRSDVKKMAECMNMSRKKTTDEEEAYVPQFRDYEEDDIMFVYKLAYKRETLEELLNDAYWALHTRRNNQWIISVVKRCLEVKRMSSDD